MQSRQPKNACRCANFSAEVSEHFTSHFDTTGRHPESHAIRLAGCALSEFSVELRELESAFYNFDFDGHSLPEREARPFVFVNA